MSDDQPGRAGLPRRTLMIAVPTLAALGAGSAFAIAAIPSSDGTINGCYETQTANTATDVGVLRVIASTTECHNDEKQISWNQQGPTGPQGARGSDGAQGAQGAEGPQGAQGPAGQTPGPAQYDNTGLYLQLPGVTGTSTVDGHKGEIPITTFGWGGSSSGSKAHPSTSLQDFSISRQADRTSPKLFDAMTHGKGFATATVTSFANMPGTAAGGPTYTYRLSDANVSSISEGGATGAGLPSESLTLHFARIKVTITDAAGGSTSATFKVKHGKLVRVR
jgi:type VI protein secretion system component Hcp